MNPAEATHAARFREWLQRPEETLDLATGALLFSLNEYPDLDIDLYLGRLDGLGRAARRRLEGRRDPYQIVRALNRVIFEDEGFAGNSEYYYDPRNSFLNEVLDRKLGIPISLSAVYLEVAARNRLPVRGVDFPGHFIVRYEHPDDSIYVDPFNRGRVLTREDLRDMLARFAGAEAELDESSLRVVGPRDILRRMLRNLKRIYADAAAWPRMHWTTECLLLLPPASPEDIRDHGLAAMRLGRYPEALNDLLRYAALAPAAADAAQTGETIRDLRRLAALAN